jgi:hypothetical protein
VVSLEVSILDNNSKRTWEDYILFRSDCVIDSFLANRRAEVVDHGLGTDEMIYITERFVNPPA